MFVKNHGIMNYYISKVIESSFADAVENITVTLKEQGFGIVTDVDLSGNLGKNGIDIPQYRLLGACNAAYAHKAVVTEPMIGVMLPCGVMVRQLEGNKVEVATIDPVSTMESIKNDEVKEFAFEVKEKLQNAIEAL